MITDEQLKQWRELAEKATPGEWKVKIDNDYDESADQWFSWPMGIDGVISYSEYAGDASQATMDFNFIAAAREAVPALIEEVEAARMENNLLRDALVKIVKISRSWEGREKAPFWNLGDIASAALRGDK